MSNETKRDVFDEVLEEWQVDETMPDANWKYPDFKLVRVKEKRFKDRYDAALPDDLPVIPKAVGKYIKTNRGHMSLTSGVENASCISEWLWGKGFDYGNDSVFARAWLLGVWRVEETGEVVKL